MLLEMPDHLSKKIQDYLRPVEGFRIHAGDYYKMDDCIIKIFKINWIKNENKFYISGARWMPGTEEPIDRGGWDIGFGISIPKPKNKFCDHIYPFLDESGTFGRCFDGIEINKLNKIKK